MTVRIDAPVEFSPDRRQLLAAGAALIGAAVWNGPMHAAQALPAAAAPDAVAPFLELSQLLIPHRLDGEVGRRLALAMAASDPALSSQIDALLQIARARGAKIVEDFFPDIPDGPLRERALKIISAWYLGVIDDVPGTEVISFELALIYQPTRDVMTIPSYAISGPNGWNSEAPPLGEMPTF